MINCPGHAGLADWECCKCSSHGAPVAGLCRALLGGFGVFYTPHVAALALILLGAVQAVSHFIRGAVKLPLLRWGRNTLRLATAPAGAYEQHHESRDDAEQARQHEGLEVAAVFAP